VEAGEAGDGLDTCRFGGFGQGDFRPRGADAAPPICGATRYSRQTTGHRMTGLSSPRGRTVAFPALLGDLKPSHSLWGRPVKIVSAAEATLDPRGDKGV
jgi:hypothetical protein